MPPSEPPPALSPTEARAQVALPAGLVPLNHCSQAPPTQATLDAAEAFLQSWQRDGMDWELWIGEVERARGAFARLIGADVSSVAVFSSVSHAAAAVASALSFRGERSKVVLSEAEFPTVAHVWGWQERRGAHLEWIPCQAGEVDPDRMAESIGPDTRLVSIAHGHYESGALLPAPPVATAAREAGALSFLDAYQTLGTRRIDVESVGVDFLACGSLKYLMGVAGIAFLYVRPTVAETLEPGTTGWFGRVDPFAFDPHTVDWAAGARRFDSGTPPILPAYIAAAGMDFLARMGADAVEQRVTSLSSRAIDVGAEAGLTLLGPRTADRRTANVAFDCGNTPSHDVESAMRERGFLASGRGRAIRLAPHAYTSEADVDGAIRSLAEILMAP